MTLLPSLPFEFLVRGIPISLQGSPQSRDEWKEPVRTAARADLPEGAWLLTDPLAVTIYIFPGAEMRGDIDNRVKPILDAMSRCVYTDDRQIERVVVQKFEPGRLFAFRSPTGALFSALQADEPVVYIRVSGNPHEDLS